MRHHPEPRDERRAPRRSRAFTLVEILIVVVILGILSVLVIPNLAGASIQAGQTAFATDIRQFANVAALYNLRTGQFFPDTASGIWQAELDGYIRQSKWESRTPIGGAWDAELNSFAITSAFGVHFNGPDTQDAAYMTEVDQLFDDGDIATGSFRDLDGNGDRYYYVVLD